MKFEPKNREIVFQPTGDLMEKVKFIQNLYDKASEKINHFDRLRQQLINYSLLAFSALLAFIIKTEQAWMHVAGCLAVVALMVIFRSLDYRYHKATHGFWASMFVFGQAMAYLLDKPSDEVRFFQYHAEGEKTTEKWNLQTRIYASLGAAALILGFITSFGLLFKR